MTETDLMTSAALGVLLESEPIRQAFDEAVRCRDACSDYGYRTGSIGDHHMMRLNEDFQRAAVNLVDALRRAREGKGSQG